MHERDYFQVAHYRTGGRRRMARQSTADGCFLSPKVADRYFPVALDSIDERALAMDLYLKANRDADPVLYRSEGVEFSIGDRTRLIEQGVEFLYVPMRQHKAYQRALNQRLDALFKDHRAEPGGARAGDTGLMHQDDRRRAAAAGPARGDRVGAGDQQAVRGLGD